MQNPLLFLLPLLPLFLPAATAQGGDGHTATVPFHVGVLLDTTIPVGITGNLSISIALEDFYSQHKNYTTRLVIHTRDTGNSTVGAVSAALDLLRNQKVQAIIGPQRSDQAVFIANLANLTHVPTISFSVTSPILTSSHPPYFIRAASTDSSQVDAISSLAKAFGWRQVVPIYEDSNFGIGVIPYLIDSLQAANAHVPYRSVIPLDATDSQILEELYKLMTMETRVFVVHMSPSLGSRLFLKADEIGMMAKGYVWIITDAMTNKLLASMNGRTVAAMQGAIGVGHYVRPTQAYEDFGTRFKRRMATLDYDKIKSGGDPSIYDLWAYDVIWALAMAAETVKSELDPQPASQKNSSVLELEDLPVSGVGPRLRDLILNTNFNGVAGEFLLVDNQLQSTMFEMVNVNGKAGRVIGYWSPTHGFSRRPPPLDRKMYSASAADLGAVIWPGDSTSVPQGWQTPTSGKVLRIGVPTRSGFDEFVKVDHDGVTNATTVTGYCIDVFEAVVRELPFAVRYEFVPFEKIDGEMAGNYDDLVKQVYYKEFDAVVGDTTITAKRSHFVDFSLPYTENGVAMVVPVRKDPRKSMWIFLKPLKLGLWLAIVGFMCYTGFVVWVIERKTNEELKGRPWHQQLGVIFYFICGTVVSSTSLDIKSNLSRPVVIIWAFVVLVLVSSYTASLTSILTVAKLEPTFTDMKQLVKNGDMIGYQKGSFLKGLLSKTFDENKMIPLEGPEKYAQALNNGSVSVVFTEIPYIRLFLMRYCTGYTMSDPTHKTAGFGFAFPKESPLLPDISRAILNVTVKDQFARLDKKWFSGSCPNQDNAIQPHSLTFQSLWGLFLFTGATSVLAVLVSLVAFFHREWDRLRSIGRMELTKSAKIHAWFKHYGAFKDRNNSLDSKHDASSDSQDGSQSPLSTSALSFATASPIADVTMPYESGSSPEDESQIQPEITHEINY